MTTRLRTTDSRNSLIALLSLLLLLLAAIFSGIGLAIVGSYFAAGAFVVTMIVMGLFLPLEHLLWGGWILTYLVAGQLQYFAHIGKAFWLPYLFGALLFARLPMELTAMRKMRTPSVISSNPLVYWALGFFAIVLASTIINVPPIAQILLSLKEYLFLWSILVILGLGLASHRYFSHTWHAMLWLVPLHIPIILYQRFVVAAGRTDHAAFDAVVGLFGGDAERAGATGAMGIFLLFTFLLAISFWRIGQMRATVAIGIGLIVFFSVLLAEVKLVILLIPIAIAILYRRQLLRQPIQALFMLAVALLFTALISTAYKLQFGSKYNSYDGAFGYIEHAIEVNSDSQFFNPATGEIGRIASLQFWWQQHSLSDPVTLLIGHGMGASRYGSVMGEQAAKNRFFRIDRSTAAVYLWETGLLGLGAFLGFLIASAKLAAALSQDPRLGARERAVLEAIFPVLAFMPVVLLYNSDLNSVPQIQLLIMLMVGQCLFSARGAARNSIALMPTSFPPRLASLPLKHCGVTTIPYGKS